MRSGRTWWLVAGILWAVLPFTMGLVESSFRLQTPLALGAILALALVEYLWAVPGVIGAVRSGRTVRRQVSGSVIVVLGAAIPYVLSSWVIPIVWDASGGGIGWALFGAIPIFALLRIIGLAGIVVGWFVAGEARARVLWSLPIGFAILLATLYLPIFVYPIAGFGTVLGVIGPVLTVAIVVALALPRRTQPNSAASLDTPSDSSASPSA